MYQSGNQSDYASRLHSLVLTSLPTGAEFIPSGLADIETFAVEGGSYLDGISAASGRYERELRLKQFQLTQSGESLLTQML